MADMVVRTLDEAGVAIAYPQRAVHGGGAGARGA